MELRAADIDSVEKFLMLESTDYWIAEVRVKVILHKCLFKLHLQDTVLINSEISLYYKS